MITERHVLTAAHCTVNTYRWLLRFGDTNLDDSEDDFDTAMRVIEKTFTHPKWGKATGSRVQIRIMGKLVVLCNKRPSCSRFTTTWPSGR